MPSRSTLCGWPDQFPDFGPKLAYAQRMQAHAIAEKGVTMASEATPETANAVRVKFEAYKWFAGKKLPSVFGDKVLHTGGDGEGPVGVKLSLDYSLLTPQQLVQLRDLITAATPRAEAPLMIEGEAEGGDDGDA